jgi:hypothetical protein
MDAGASEEYRIIVLFPGSGGFRTPAEKCRPPGQIQAAGSLREIPFPCCGDYGDYLRGFFLILSYPGNLRFHPRNRAASQWTWVGSDAWVSGRDKPPARGIADNKKVVLF